VEEVEEAKEVWGRSLAVKAPREEGAVAPGFLSRLRAATP
jgi:hypothetical protein